MTNPHMERVLYNLHAQLCSNVLRLSSHSSRALLEHVVLVSAVCAFAGLWMVHLAYRSGWSDLSSMCLRSVEGFREDVDVSHIVLMSDSGESSAELWTEGTVESAVWSYAKSKGYFFLEDIQRHNITAQVLRISSTDANCFGEPFLQSLLQTLQSTDVAMLHWIRGDSYAYHHATERIYDLSAAPTRKLAVVVKTIFLYFCTTTLVSFTLRETQARMLDFTHQLQERVRSGRPVVSLVVSHLVDSLVFCPVMVGMIGFLIEFYQGDKVLAFCILSVVWVWEAFSVVSLRSWQGMSYFPRIFFLLFCLWHFYFFSFPRGFYYPALTCTVLFMAHSMLFFWHRYELPAFVRGTVNQDRPRMIPQHQSSPLPPPPPPAIRHPLLFRQHSHSSISNHYRSQTPLSSRQASSAALYRPEEEEESYVYFMDGEVVLHRPQQPPQVVTTMVEEADATSLGDPLDTQQPTPLRHNRSDHASHRVPTAPRVPTLEESS